jgi:hypothetical protein
MNRHRKRLPRALLTKDKHSQVTTFRSWSNLPGKTRDRIYEACLLLEGQEPRKVCHRLHGFRRSRRNDGTGPNFTNSSWGFAQVNRHIRAKTTLWLLK